MSPSDQCNCIPTIHYFPCPKADHRPLRPTPKGGKCNYKRMSHTPCPVHNRPASEGDTLDIDYSYQEGKRYRAFLIDKPTASSSDPSDAPSEGWEEIAYECPILTKRNGVYDIAKYTDAEDCAKWNKWEPHQHHPLIRLDDVIEWLLEKGKQHNSLPSHKWPPPGDLLKQLAAELREGLK